MALPAAGARPAKPWPSLEYSTRGFVACELHHPTPALALLDGDALVAHAVDEQQRAVELLVLVQRRDRDQVRERLLRVADHARHLRARLGALGPVGGGEAQRHGGARSKGNGGAVAVSAVRGFKSRHLLVR